MARARSNQLPKIDPLVKKLLPEFALSDIDGRLRNLEIEEVYRIDGAKMGEIVNKIAKFKTKAGRRPSVFIRKNGMQISGYYENPNSTSSGDPGMIVAGANFPYEGIKKSEVGAYLITFTDSDLSRKEVLQPNLVDLLREYII